MKNKSVNSGEKGSNGENVETCEWLIKRPFVLSQFCSVGGKSPSERRCNFPGVATFQRFKRLGSPRRPFAWRRWEDVTRYKPLNLIKSSRKNRLESNATQFDVNIQAPDFRYGDNASVKAQLPRLHVLFLTVYSFRLLGRGVT